MAKKFLFFFLTLLINYILLTFLVFLFSYFSLVNGKTYDFFWVKSIQEKLYMRGLRNIWQYNNNCINFDKDLLYVPKDGECVFNNFEFNTTLNFKDGIRSNGDNSQLTDRNSIILLGDSIAMGWGVNDNQTFASHLQNLTNRKVYNMGISSYGTVRELKKLINSNIYKTSKTILIQYHYNDLFENKYLDSNKVYTLEEFERNFKSNSAKLDKTIFFLKMFKTSLRLSFADLFDKLNPSANYYYIDFEEHIKLLEKLIYENLDYSNKKIIVFFIKEPNMKISNFPVSNKNIEYILIELDKKDFFIIDEHPNEIGHFEIANKINKNL